jgi:hypothetical protein
MALTKSPKLGKVLKARKETRWKWEKFGDKMGLVK